jgi:hypothetical protein
MTSPISPITGSTGQTTTANVSAGSGSDLTMQDFFTLIAAQLQNQNMLEPEIIPNSFHRWLSSPRYPPCRNSAPALLIFYRFPI